MNFFEQQSTAKSQTNRLIFLFILAVIAIVITVHSFLTLSWMHMVSSKEAIAADPLGFSTFVTFATNPQAILFTSAFTLPVIALGSLYKIFTLRAGGKQVATLLGGRLLSPESDESNERKLLNIVEEISIASGTPVPPVYIIEEDSINAFAAGFTISDAVIGVNRGTINLLSRDELQGVVAHEFSHILNGDMRLNLKLIGVVHGILVISIIGRMLLNSASRSSRHSSRNSDRKGELMLYLFGAGLMWIGWIGVLSGRLIKAAISRQREFLADASAVQFTRNPDGISGALKKIGGWMHGSQISHPRAEEISHLFFSNALGKSFMQLFATHPPLVTRIQRIDPHFKGEFTPVELSSMKESPNDGLLSKFQSPPKPSSQFPEFSAVETIGEITPYHIVHSHNLLSEIPLRIHQETKSLLGAQGVVFALLLSTNDEVATKQLSLLDEAPLLKASTVSCHSLLKTLENIQELRLPLIDLSLPSLRELHENETDIFMKKVEEFVLADHGISLFEYMLSFILKRHLTARPAKDNARGIPMRKFSQEAQKLLSAAVYISSTRNGENSMTYLAGAKEIEELRDTELIPLGDQILQSVSSSLTALQNTSWSQKERLLRGLQRIILFDETVTVNEAELFRAIADSLGCPVPPVLQYTSNKGEE